jgi:hypothetical protein
MDDYIIEWIMRQVQYLEEKRQEEASWDNTITNVWIAA